MSDNTYNGWSNYETWRINLEVCDDYCSSLVEDRMTFDSLRDLAQSLQYYVEEMIDDDGGNGFAVSLANSFISDVNWEEIADHYDGELFNVPPECDDCGEHFPHGDACGNDLMGKECDACSIDETGYCRRCAARNE